MSMLDFNSSIRFNSSWNSLKYKYENKIKSEEFYLYQLLGDEVSLIALNIGLNHNLCEALCKVHGFAFCDYGIAAWKLIEEYLISKNIKADINKLKTDIVKRRIKSVKCQPNESFEKYVDELFVDNPSLVEVKLVQQAFKVCKTLQPLKNTQLSLYYELVSKALSEIKENYKTSKEIISVDLSKYIPQEMDELSTVVEESEKKEMLEGLDDAFASYYLKDSTYENLVIALSCFIG